MIIITTIIIINHNHSHNCNNIIIMIMRVMSRPACGAPAFTEHSHSKSPDLCKLINPYGYQYHSNSIGGFAGSLRDW